MNYSLSVVIPCYNEALNIKQTIQDVVAGMPASISEYEIIAVNDGSRDDTGQVICELLPIVPGLRIVEHVPNRGYGGALKAGFVAAQKDLIAFTPGDGQFKFSELPKLLDALKPEISLVSGIRVNRQDNAVRKLNAFLWNSVIRLFFGKLLSDIDCGFKVFRRSALDGVTLNSNGAMIDTEMLARLKAKGCKFAEVPVTHLPRTAGNPTGANPLVILKAFRDLARVRMQI